MPERTDSERLREFLKAARQADWQQVVLNGGPPCFCILDGKFCLRAQRWIGHARDRDHEFVTLEAALRQAIKEPMP